MLVNDFPHLLIAISRLIVISCFLYSSQIGPENPRFLVWSYITKADIREKHDMRTSAQIIGRRPDNPFLLLPVSYGLEQSRSHDSRHDRGTAEPPEHPHGCYECRWARATPPLSVPGDMVSAAGYRRGSGAKRYRQRYGQERIRHAGTTVASGVGHHQSDQLQLLGRHILPSTAMESPPAQDACSMRRTGGNIG